MIIELGLTEKIWNIENDNIKLTTLNEMFQYTDGIFWSDGEKVGEVDEVLSLKIFAKLAKYGEYVNRTTSNSVMSLINYCKKNNIEYTLIDKNDNKITKYQDRGSIVFKKFECPVCLDEKYVGLKLKCNHIYCSKCLRKWLKNNKHCPYCRKSTYLDKPDIIQTII
tara:strand:+ start:2829 stop:3326 length:498 start_codon:yes stop_codon:yes gene_type:complete